MSLEVVAELSVPAQSFATGAAEAESWSGVGRGGDKIAAQWVAKSGGATLETTMASRGITLPDGAPDDPPTRETVHGLGNRKNELLLDEIDRHGVDTFPDAVHLLRAAHDAHVPCAVVSASANTARVLDATGLARMIDASIDGIVAHERRLAGKPAPDTFLAGAEALGVAPPDAAVFEDAIAGVAAGRAGRFGLVVGVDRRGADHATALREAGADLVVTDLSRLADVVS